MSDDKGDWRKDLFAQKEQNHMMIKNTIEKLGNRNLGISREWQKIFFDNMIGTHIWSRYLVSPKYNKFRQRNLDN